MTTTPTQEMPKNFNFAEAETRLYAAWEKQGYFKPEVAPADAKPFVIAIPPPNVTGELHLGHAMFVSLEDLMIRYERMRGKAALWIPGTDHAGIATQLQVERLLRSEGTSREEVGREEFLHRTWEWKEKYGGAIINQLRRMGASCDWDRLRFTLDETLSKAVREAFITLWDQGLLYRGPRLINWSPGLQTAVSDLEVEREEETVTLYYFKYMIDGTDEYIPVATIRPETILGDTAVAVHPEDPRYERFIGKRARVPMTDRTVPVIADDYVEREFGTGGLKVTPAHDFNDYELAQRHNLPVINIMNKDASLNENGGKYAGMDRYEARKQLWADMEAAGLTIKTEPYTTTIPRTQRGGEVVEPMISTQWFVKMEPLAAKGLEAVRDGRIKIVPDRFEKVYFGWLENIKDWCISRQLWWGHRIPAFYCPNGHITVERDSPVKCATCGSTELVQDDDVLDTWFSSGLWPFSTLGWPQQTPDLLRYYPTDVLETGYDILFFWVARMIMQGLWLTDKIPFHTVYLHGLVRDKNGEKMSKTKGNVIDPLIMMDKFGTDSLRYTLITGGTPGNDQNISEERIEYGRNFGNKLWQMSRFVITNLGESYSFTAPDPAKLDVPSRWILSRLNGLIASVQRLFDTYQYGEAGRQIKDFLWEEFADWYVEISKDALYGKDEDAKKRTRDVLVQVIDTALRLLHPFIPFITEEIWQYVPATESERKPLILSQWATSNAAFLNPAAEAEMDTIRDLVVKVRQVRLDYNVEPSKRIEALVGGSGLAATVAANPQIFARLCNVERMDGISNGGTPDNAAVIASGEVTLYLPLAGMVDLGAERERLLKELESVKAQIDQKEKLLGNEGFTSRAKPDVVQRERDKLAELAATRASVEARLEALPS
ncbi:MAG: valine--tRNA ligase [Anaerolineae bacterium]|nr:valine--tRNA ligase [Anaerolineae bacterium]